MAGRASISSLQYHFLISNAQYIGRGRSRTSLIWYIYSWFHFAISYQALNTRALYGQGCRASTFSIWYFRYIIFLHISSFTNIILYDIERNYHLMVWLPPRCFSCTSKVFSTGLQRAPAMPGPSPSLSYQCMHLISIFMLISHVNNISRTETMPSLFDAGLIFLFTS